MNEFAPKKPLEYKVGDKISGVEIAYIIAQSPEIIVFLDKENKIGFKCSSESMQEQVNLALPYLHSGSMRIGPAIEEEKIKKDTLIGLGHAFYSAARSEKNDKSEFFTDVIAYIDSKAQEASQLNYVISGLMFCILLILISGLLYFLFKNNYREIAGIFQFGMMGSVGAMISIGCGSFTTTFINS